MNQNIRGIVIFGAGAKGIILSRMLKCQDIALNIQHSGDIIFCDNYKSEGSFIEGIELIHPDKLLSIQDSVEVFISSDKIVDDVIMQLHELDYKGKVWYVPDYSFRFRWNGTRLPFATKIDISKPRMPWLEYMVVEHCNLKCRGCSAMSNVNPPIYSSVERFEKDLLQLKKLFSGIKYLKLYGGEPLLHPQLADFIDIARAHFKDAELVVHSNGLLVTNMPQVLVNIMRENDCKFVFTLYPPTGVIKRRIEQFLSKEDISYSFTPPVYEFRKSINPKGDYDADKIFRYCRPCVNLINGKLSCGMDYFFEKFEESFGGTIPAKIEEHSVDIYTTGMNGWEINSFLNTSYEACKYCAFMNLESTNDDGRFFPWNNKGKSCESDWIV